MLLIGHTLYNELYLLGILVELVVKVGVKAAQAHQVVLFDVLEALHHLVKKSLLYVLPLQRLFIGHAVSHDDSSAI